MATPPKPLPFTRVLNGQSQLPQRKCACSAVPLITAILNLEEKVRNQTERIAILEQQRIELLEALVHKFGELELTQLPTGPRIQ